LPRKFVSFVEQIEKNDERFEYKAIITPESVTMADAQIGFRKYFGSAKIAAPV